MTEKETTNKKPEVEEKKKVVEDVKKETEEKVETKKKEKETKVEKQGKTEDKKVEVEKDEEKPVQEKKSEEDKKPEVKEKPKTVKPKKTEAVVNATNVPISTKHSMAICDFIRKKKIDKAIEDLEQVMIFKKAIPMKGEIPHRKGKGMSSGSGRFPVKSVGNFLVLLKSLSGNATYNSIEEPVIVKAVANIGVRPYGRFGRVRKKRTHVTLIAKSQIKKKQKSGGKK